ILVNEWLHALQDKKIRVYVDGTLGAGGHAEAVLNAHPEIETFYGIDQDKDALNIAKERLKSWEKKTHFIHSNFSLFDQVIQEPIDALLLDLGVSSMQLDQKERGFSFSKDGPLDMRMNPESSLSAEDIVNNWDEKELATLFFELGEERKSRQAAKMI